MLFVDLFKLSALSLASNGQITINDEFKKKWKENPVYVLL